MVSREGENDKRCRCKCCQTKTPYFCVQCDQFVCLFNGTGEHDCWWRFHNIPGEDMLKLTPAQEETKKKKDEALMKKKK